MSKKNLLIVTILLVAVAAFVQFYSKRDHKQDDTPVGKPIASVNLIEKIDEIVIEKGTQQIHLQKSESGWTIAEKKQFPADTEKLVRLLDNITSYHVATLITRDKKRLADFQLQDKAGSAAAGTRLSLKNGDKTIFSMRIGKNRDSVSDKTGRPPHPDGTYIIIGGAPVVYLIKENLSLDAGVDDWMRKVLVTIGKDEIKAVKFETPAFRFTLERSTAKTDLTLSDLTKNEIMNKQTQADMLNELEEFQIEAALPMEDKLEKSLQLKSEITASLFNGSNLRFQILSKTSKNPLAKKKEDQEETTYFAKLLEAGSTEENKEWQQLNKLGNVWLFKLDDWRAKTWIKTRKEFLKTGK